MYEVQSSEKHLLVKKKNNSALSHEKIGDIKKLWHTVQKVSTAQVSLQKDYCMEFKDVKSMGGYVLTFVGNYEQKRSEHAKPSTAGMNQAWFISTQDFNHVNPFIPNFLTVYLSSYTPES